jgi:release factor glutamine methyltransferase
MPACEPRPASLGDALVSATTLLRRAGFRDARREAAELWAVLTGGSVGDTWLARERDADPAALAHYREAVRRRAAGEPRAYAAGRAGFRTLALAADRRALIPRPETEGLVERVLAWAREAGDAARQMVVADVGTGSGCIALSLAVEARFARIIATDVSADALDLARENVARVAPPVAVDLRQGDLLEPLLGESIHVLVANPPYLTEAEYAALDPSVRGYEPRDALVGGWDGLSAIRRLIQGGNVILVPGGLLAMELDSERADAAAGLARRAGWRDVRVERDLFGRRRFLLATWSER